MALKENQPAPDFTLASTEGHNFTLSQHAKGKPLILYFYPKDFTSVCTREACEFRDHFEYFRDLDITIYGISPDDLATHHRFRQMHQLPFHLLSDPKNRVASLYKAQIPLINLTRRITYLLNGQHQIIKAFEKMFGAEAHIQQMVKKLQE